MEGNLDRFEVKKNMECLAVEIGVSDLKVARVRIQKGESEIVSFNSVDISGASEEKISQSLSEIVSGIKGMKNPYVLNVIPSKFVIFKNIEIPSTDKKEIADIIDLQAGRHTPYSRDEIILDHINLGMVHESYSKILLAIVKKDVITNRYELIKNAGLKADKAVLSSEALAKYYARSASYKSGSAPSALVSLDRASMDFIVEKGGESLYIRSVSLEGGDISGTILDNIKSSMESYQAENIGVLPKKICLTGYVAAVQGKEEELRKSLSVDCSILSESNLLGIDRSRLSSLQGGRNISILSVVTPPAVIDDLQLNLIPEDIKIKKKIREKATLVTKVGLLAITSLVLFSSVFLTDMVFKKLYLKRLRSSYTAEIKEAGVLKKITGKSDDIEMFLRKKGEGLTVLTKLFNAIPPEVYINNLNLRDDHTLSLNGTADTMSRVFSLVTSLEDHEYFSNVSVESTRSRRVEGKEVADFGLTLVVKKES